MPSANDASIDDDDSSTEREMQKLWDKLDRMQAAGRLKLQQQKATKTFECPVSSASSCSMMEDESLQSPVRNNNKSPTCVHVETSPVSDTPQAPVTLHRTPFNSAGRLKTPDMVPKASDDNSHKRSGLGVTVSDRSNVHIDSLRNASPIASVESSQGKETRNDSPSHSSRVQAMTRRKDGIPIIISATQGKNDITGDDAGQWTESPGVLDDGDDKDEVGHDDSVSTSSTEDSSSSDSSSSSSASSSASSTSSSDINPVDHDTQKVGDVVPEAGICVGSPTPQLLTRTTDRVKNPYSKPKRQNEFGYLEASGEQTIKTSKTASRGEKQAEDRNRIHDLDDADSSRISFSEGRTQRPKGENQKAHSSRFFPNTTEAKDDDSPPNTRTAEKLVATESAASNLSQLQSQGEPRNSSGSQQTKARSKDTEETNNSSKLAPHDHLNNISATLPIQEYHAHNDLELEVDFSLYAPPEVQDRLPPVLHSFNQNNCPLNSRRHIPVRDLFQSPICNLWSSKIERFNAIQSTVSNAVCHSDDHVVVSAPTGAGKTAIFEMAMARFFSVDLSSQPMHPNGHKQVSKRRKIVYIAPSKALCEERHEDWCRRLAFINVGIQVVMITGDVEPGRCYQDFADAHVILSTPEKWDSISRRWSEKFFLMASVKLFMIDEVHLLGDESRGSCLESTVSRMKSIQRAARAIRVSQNEVNSSR
jgi:hypothetical protein